MDRNIKRAALLLDIGHWRWNGITLLSSQYTETSGDTTHYRWIGLSLDQTTDYLIEYVNSSGWIVLATQPHSAGFDFPTTIGSIQIATWLNPETSKMPDVVFVGENAVHTPPMTPSLDNMGIWTWNNKIFTPSSFYDDIFLWQTDDTASYGIKVQSQSYTNVKLLHGTTEIGQYNVAEGNLDPSLGDRIPSGMIDGFLAQNIDRPLPPTIPPTDADYIFVHFTCSNVNKDKFPTSQGGDAEDPQLFVTVNDGLYPLREGVAKSVLRIVDIMFLCEACMTRGWVLRRLTATYGLGDFHQWYATELIVRNGITARNAFYRPPVYSKPYPAIRNYNQGYGDGTGILNVMELLHILATFSSSYSAITEGASICGTISQEDFTATALEISTNNSTYEFLVQIGYSGVSQEIWSHLNSLWRRISDTQNAAALLTMTDWEVVYYILSRFAYVIRPYELYKDGQTWKDFQVTTYGERYGQPYEETEPQESTSGEYYYGCTYIASEYHSQSVTEQEKVTASSFALNHEIDYGSLTQEQAESLYSFSSAFEDSLVSTYAIVLCTQNASYYRNQQYYVDKRWYAFVPLDKRRKYMKTSTTHKSAFSFTWSDFWNSVYATLSDPYTAFKNTAQGAESWNYDIKFTLLNVYAAVNLHKTNIAGLNIPAPVLSS